MGWNYRVVRRSTNDNGQPLAEPFFGIYEGKADIPHSITIDPVTAVGDDLEDLRRTLLDLMGLALSEPILNWEDFDDKIIKTEATGL